MTRAMKRFIGWLMAILVLILLFILTGPFFILKMRNSIINIDYGKEA